MRYLLAPDGTLIVRGPASLRLLSGEATVLGAPLEHGRKLVVRQEKQLPIEAKSEVDVEIILGESGKIFEIEGGTIPASWRSAVEAIAEMAQGKVLVIGATDVGKSTLCTYLTNELLKRGLRLRLIDADIGQADIGPPTTIASATPAGFLSSLVDLNPDAMIFIGHTSPSQVETQLIEGIKRLGNQDQQSLTIINTDGWALDPEAILYKIKLITATEPDLVVGLATGTELQPILSGSRAISINVEAPEIVLTRSRSDRREIRIAGYRRFLDGGTTRTLPLRKVKVRMPKGFPPLQSRYSRELSNLIVGLLDEKGYLLQIGVLLDFGTGLLKVYSRPIEGVREIELGYVKLSTDGVELGYLEF